MPLFTIYDLIILALITVSLLIFLKPKGILAGVKIMFASLKIFANHKMMFLQNALFLIFIRVITPIIIVVIIYGVAIIINTATDKINISFLHNFMAIAGLIWIFGSAILAGLSFQILVSFAQVIFYRQLLQIITEDNSERKFSFKEIIGQEIRHYSKFLKFFLALVSVIISTWIKAFLMMIEFLFSSGRFSLNRYLLPRYVKQVLCYVPMEYALYHNSPKQAIIKSYQINREWTALSIYGVAVSFLVAMMIAFFIYYVMSHLNDINILFNMEMLVEKIGATPTMILFWFIFVIIILSFSVPLCLPISAFYFIVYLNYNNSILEGKTDKFSKDFGLFGSFLDDIEDTLVKKFGSESMPIYEKYIPIKEKYKKMIEL